jgi:hypothetical protein
VTVAGDGSKIQHQTVREAHRLQKARKRANVSDRAFHLNFLADAVSVAVRGCT